MGKTSERLKDCQTQMSIYAEQHILILASDVLDMIEQLQDDLKDDVDNVVAEIKEYSFRTFGEIRTENVVEMVRRGGVE